MLNISDYKQSINWFIHRNSTKVRHRDSELTGFEKFGSSCGEACLEHGRFQPIMWGLVWKQCLKMVLQIRVVCGVLDLRLSWGCFVPARHDNGGVVTTG